MWTALFASAAIFTVLVTGSNGNQGFFWPNAASNYYGQGQQNLGGAGHNQAAQGAQASQANGGAMEAAKADQTGGRYDHAAGILAGFERSSAAATQASGEYKKGGVYGQAQGAEAAQHLVQQAAQQHEHPQQFQHFGGYGSGVQYGAPQQVLMAAQPVQYQYVAIPQQQQPVRYAAAPAYYAAPYNGGHGQYYAPQQGYWGQVPDGHHGLMGRPGYDCEHCYQQGGSPSVSSIAIAGPLAAGQNGMAFLPFLQGGLQQGFQGMGFPGVLAAGSIGDGSKARLIPK